MSVECREGNVAGRIAEMVDVNDASGTIGQWARCRTEHYRVVDRPSKCSQRCRFGAKHARDRLEDVAAVEGRARLHRAPGYLMELAGPMQPDRPGYQAVVGADD